MSFKTIPLQIVLKNISSSDTLAVTERLHELLGQNLAEEVRKLTVRPKIEASELYRASLAQLAQCVAQYHSQWHIWDTAAVKAWLPDVVKACHWKLSLPFWDDAEASKNGVFLAQNLQFYLAKHPTNLPKLRRDRLLNYLDKVEKENVSARALKVALPILRKLPNKTLFFQLTPDQKIVIQAGLIARYLYEQTAFYVYLYLDENEGAFLDEAWGYVERYVCRCLRKSSIPDYEQVAQDVVQDCIIIFLQKKKEYQGGTFFINKRIRAYLIDLIRSYKLIAAQFKKNNKQLYLDENLEELLLDPLDIDGNLFMDSSPETDMLNQIVQNCLNEIGQRCKDYLKLHYLSDYTEPLPYHEMAEDLNTPLRTIERWMPRCKDDWQMCIINKTTAQGLRI